MPYTEAEARVHFVRFRDLLQVNTPDPNALTIDGGITVQDAVRNKSDWLKETNAVGPAPIKQQKKKAVAAKADEQAAQDKAKKEEQPFSDWEAWPEVQTSALIPEQARKLRPTPQFLRHFALAAWNPPPQNLRLQGHYFYIHAITQENEVFYIAATTNGFYVSNTTSSTFDPTPKAGAQAAASLHDLFLSLSPQFAQHFVSVFQDPLGARDVLAVMGVTTTQAAYPWLARRFNQQTDPLRSQMAYLLTGGTSPETVDAGRDWNEDLQTTRELPQDTLADRQVRERYLARINFDFTQAALRAVPRVAAGDVVAMNPTDPVDAHMYVTNNLFISKGLDGVGLYPHVGGDEAAHVAVSKDTSALALINTASVPGMSTLATCLVDWKGERWVVQSIVPGLFRKHEDPPLDEAELAEQETKAAERAAAALAEAGAVAKAEVAKAEGRAVEQPASTLDPLSLEETSIVYGGVDSASVIRSDKVMHKLFGLVAKQLHLAEHEIEDKDGNKHALWGGIECKGLLGSDGRRYVLDLARLNPVDIEWLENDLSSKAVNSDQSVEDYPHKFTVLRPQLLEAYWTEQFSQWVGEKRSALLAKAAELEGDEKAKAIDELKLDADEFQLAFNADAFVEFRVSSSEEGRAPEYKVVVKDETDPTVAAVRAASKWMREIAIPRFVTDSASGLVQIIDGVGLTKQLHLRGINVRYLGLVASLCAPENKDKLQTPAEPLDPGYQAYLDTLQRIAVLEMVQRAAKRIFRKVLKEARADEQLAVTSHFLNCLLGGLRNAHPEPLHLSTPFDLGTDSPEWTKLTPASTAALVVEEVGKRFRYALPSDYLELGPKKQILRAVCQANGIQLQLRDYDFEAKEIASEAESPAPNGQAPAAGEGKKKNKRRRAADKPKPNALATAAILAAVNANTTFVPTDVLNIVPVMKDSNPSPAFIEELMDAGRLSLQRGDRAMGLDLMHRALASYETIYGSVHPIVARAYTEFAQTIHAFATARAMEEAQAEQAKKEGKEVNLSELPEGIAEMLSFSTALKFQQQAVTIAERTIGLDAQETLLFYTNMAVMERMNKKSDQALLCQSRALELWDLIHGPDHPESIQSLNQIASTLMSSNRYEAALKVSKTAYDMCKKLFGSESYHTAQAAYVLAEAYIYVQDLKSAVEYARETHHLLNDRLGPDDEQTNTAGEFLKMLTSAAVSNAKQEKLVRENAAVLAQARAQAAGNGAPRGVAAGAAAPEGVTTEMTAEQARELLESMDINSLVRYINGSKGSKAGGKKKRGKNHRR